MDDYISRREAVDWFMSYILMDEDTIPADTVVSDLKSVFLPADVEPVVHGRWEKSEYRGFVRCSVCKDAYIDEEWLTSGKWGGCPNCRAKMDLAPPEGDDHG